MTTLTFIALVITNRLTFNTQGIFVYLTNITLLKGFFNELKFTGIAQGWSLTVEEGFYILAPFLFLQWTKVRLILPVVLLLTGSLLVLLFGPIHFYGLFSDFHFMLVYTFFGRCFEFCVGIGLAYYFKINGNRNNSWPVTYSGIVGVVAIIILLTLLGENGKSGLEHPAGVFLNNFVLPLAIAYLLYGLITELTWIQKTLSSATADLLGKSSYAFYLVHAGIFFSAIHHYVTENVLLIFALLVLSAIALYYFIEKPLNKKWRAKAIVPSE